MQYLSDIFLLSIICAFIGFGFSKMMEPEMIFTFYGKWLARMSKKSKLWYHITKPMGRCIICNTTWIGMISALIVLHGDSLIMYSIIAVGVSSAGIVVIIVNIFVRLQK